MKIRTTAAVFVFLLAAAPGLLRAQPAVPQIEQFERTQREAPQMKFTPLDLSTNRLAPELYAGENEDVGPQRILKLNPRRTYFEVVADSQYFYTDNALLSDDSKVSSALFVNTIQAAFSPEAHRVGPGQLAPMLGYRSQWFNYDLDTQNNDLSRLDFNAQTAFLNARYQMGTWQIYGGFDFTRLLNQPDYNEGYREYVPTFALQKFFPINDELIFVVGGQFSYHFTDAPGNSGLVVVGTNAFSTLTASDVNDRYDVIGNVSLSYEILPRLVLQPLYRFQYTHYGKFDDGTVIGPESRVDLIHTVGISVAYYFNKYVAVRAFASYERKDSDYSRTYDYHKFDAGGGVSLLVRF